MLWDTSRRRVFPQLFRVLPNFHECLYNSIETRYMFSISFKKNHDQKKEGIFEKMKSFSPIFNQELEQGKLMAALYSRK